MKLYIAGGCGEHGRNCFFIECAQTAFLLDCGLMPGGKSPYPRLTDKQIKAAQWLFLSHSHIDHAGAYPWLYERGFSGCAVMTRETARQLTFPLKNVLFIDDLAPPLTSTPLAAGLSVRWGRSGQCAGSAWFDIGAGNKRILFSGDYIEETLAYDCDLIRGVKADLAILDSAYGTPQTPEDYRISLIALVKERLAQGQKLLFPVPKYGRGLELVLLLRQTFPQASLQPDYHLRTELARIPSLSPWLRQAALAPLRAVETIAEPARCAGEITFISDPQLKTPEARALAEETLASGDVIILTGNTDNGSFSETLLKSGRAVFARYAVHLNNAARAVLESQNDFVRVCPFHGLEG